MYDATNGEYVVTDLVAAGFPFDVVTYDRFVNMDLGNHDVIILNGHTTPVSVATVSSKCQSAVNSGRKVFINGTWPYSRYDYTTGQIAEKTYYSNVLFGATCSGPYKASGVVTVPSQIEKDPTITAYGETTPNSVMYFTFQSDPALKIVASGKVIGFVGPHGGAIESVAEYSLSLLDYGKLVAYMRCGDTPAAGFANDRTEGDPIASFEVHCDTTSSAAATAQLDALSQSLQIPLVNLLVYRKLNTSVAATWNALTNPLMVIGSHSRTHPNDWPSLPSLASETTGALADQKLLVPKTINFLDFSGNMNPSTAQIDQLFSWGLPFGAAGSAQRVSHTVANGNVNVQRMPTNRTWFINLSKSTTTPYCLSQTVCPDNSVWGAGLSYVDEVTTSFQNDLKYGLYTYGFFHDYMFDPTVTYTTGGVPMGDQIRTALTYLKSQGARFIRTDDLIGRIRDFAQGTVVQTANTDGSSTVTVTRPNSLANELKVGCAGDLVPSATGSSIVSQHYVGRYLYLTLRPEISSTVNVRWGGMSPSTPVVSSPVRYVTPSSVATWSEAFRPEDIAEYQYCVGTQRGVGDLVPWTSTGKSTSASMQGVGLVSGRLYYVSARARYSIGGWSSPGASSAVLADTTPPKAPTVTDDGATQSSPFQLHATWSSSDTESGIKQYMYAIGTEPGGTELCDWTLTAASDINVTDIAMPPGVMCYVSVKACNYVDMWSSVGSSDGICAVPTLGASKNYPDGQNVSFVNAVVTRAFPGEFYIESQDRSAAIKVVSAIPVQEGQVMTVTGAINHDDIERYLQNPSITTTGTSSIKPLCVPITALAGGTSARIQGASEGAGLNNVGMLVKVVGKIVAVDNPYIYVDDGTNVVDMDWGYPETGAVVQVNLPHDFHAGQYVCVTGICTLNHPDMDWGFKRSVRIRSNADVQVLAH